MARASAPAPAPTFIINHRRASSTGTSTSAVAVAARREPLGPRHSDAKHLKALSEAEEKERMKVCYRRPTGVHRINFLLFTLRIATDM